MFSMLVSRQDLQFCVVSGVIYEFGLLLKFREMKHLAKIISYTCELPYLLANLKYLMVCNYRFLHKQNNYTFSLANPGLAMFCIFPKTATIRCLVSTSAMSIDESFRGKSASCSQIPQKSTKIQSLLNLPQEGLECHFRVLFVYILNTQPVCHHTTCCFAPFWFKKMLYFVGLGLGDATDITVKGLDVVKNAKRVYLEAYTSILTVGKEALVRDLQKWVSLHEVSCT